MALPRLTVYDRAMKIKSIKDSTKKVKLVLQSSHSGV